MQTTLAQDPRAGLEDTLPLIVAGRPLGRLIPEMAAALEGLADLVSRRAEAFVLCDEGMDAAARSTLLQELALRLRGLGLVPGWRDELCELREQGTELARFERAAFRSLGLRNSAVHINGVCADGRLWIARRSMSKHSSPGKLDNLAAGAISAGEEPRPAAIRELWEEAGVPSALAGRLCFPGVTIRSLHRIASGVHDENILCADLELPPEFIPRCQDGEVQSFQRMQVDDLRKALHHDEFSHEAALVTADWLQRRQASGPAATTTVRQQQAPAGETSQADSEATTKDATP